MIDCSECEYVMWEWTMLDEDVYDEWIECTKGHNTFPDECDDFKVMDL